MNKYILFGLIGIMILAVGCTPTQKGTLELKLTDAPATLDIKSLNVEISGVKVHSDGGGWVTIVNEPQTFNLIELENAEALLGQNLLGVGHYTQIRLLVNKATMVLADGKVYLLSIPSKEIKLVSPFDIGAGEKVTITLDFDAKNSIIQNANGYQMKPTIKAIYGTARILSPESCAEVNSVWKDCGSKCAIDNQGKTDVMCPTLCEPLCECGGVAGFNCPIGSFCKTPEGVADALGYCVEGIVG